MAGVQREIRADLVIGCICDGILLTESGGLVIGKLLSFTSLLLPARCRLGMGKIVLIANLWPFCFPFTAR